MASQARFAARSGLLAADQSRDLASTSTVAVQVQKRERESRRAPGSAFRIVPSPNDDVISSSGPQAGNGTASNPHHDESCGVASFFSPQSRGAFKPCGLGLATTPRIKRSAASRIICRPIRFCAAADWNRKKWTLRREREKSEERQDLRKRNLGRVAFLLREWLWLRAWREKLD